MVGMALPSFLSFAGASIPQARAVILSDLHRA